MVPLRLSVNKGQIPVTLRCTLTDLLKGRGKLPSLLCGCKNHAGSTNGVDTPPSFECEDHRPGEEEGGDEWLKTVECYSIPGTVPSHVHTKIAIDEEILLVM